MIFLSWNDGRLISSEGISAGYVFIVACRIPFNRKQVLISLLSGSYPEHTVFPGLAD